jgi:hypothetical protein
MTQKTNQFLQYRTQKILELFLKLFLSLDLIILYFYTIMFWQLLSYYSETCLCRLPWVLLLCLELIGGKTFAEHCSEILDRWTYKKHLLDTKGI